MRKNHHGKKDRLVKRVFALCLALAVICTCLVPVFATEASSSLQVNQEVSRPVEDGEATYPDGDEAAYPDEEAAGLDGDFPAVEDGAVAGFGGDEVATRPVEGGEDNLDGGPNVKETEWGTVIEYDTSTSTDPSSSTVTQWSGEDDVVEKPDDKVVVSGDEIKKLQDMVVYRFWLKELNTLDLQDIATKAQNDNMTESEYLARNGEVLWNLYFIQAVPRVETIADYSSYIENPSSNRDPEGKLRLFDYWYTLDEFGNRVRLNLTDPTSNILDDKTTTVNVYAAWKDGTVGSDEEEDVDHEDLVDKNPVPVDLTTKASASYEDEEGELKTTTLPVEVKNLPSSAHSLSVIHMGDDDMESFYKSHEDDFGSMAPILGLKISPKNAKGETVQPAKGQKATVTVSGLNELPEIAEMEETGALTADALKVLHWKDDRTVETLDVVSYENGTLTFETTSFSPFVLASKNGYAVDTMEIMTKDGGSAEISLNGSVVLSSDEKGSIKSSSWTLEDDNNSLLLLSNKQNTSVTVYARKANTQDTAVTVKHSYTLYYSSNKTYEERYTVVVKGTSSLGSKGHWVYLYVKTDATTAKKLGLETNNSGWFTVGKVYVPTMDRPTSELANSGRHFYNQSVTGTNHLSNRTETYTYDGSNWGKVVDSNGKVIGNVERYTLNTKVLLDNVQWSYGWENGSTSGSYGLIVCSGADNYISANKWSPQWHLDGYLVTEGRVIIRHFAVDDNGVKHELKDLQQIVPGAIGNVVSSDGKQYESVEYNNESYGFDHFGTPERCQITAQDQYLDIYYSRSTADLTVSKTVTGLLGEKTKAFDFELYVRNTVNTSKATWAKSLNGASVATETGNLGESRYTTNVDGVQYKVYSFTLKDNESITFKNLPAGTYYVNEVDDSASGYETSYVVGSAEPVNGRRATAVLGKTGTSVAFTNRCDLDPDTGVLLDTLPYIVILAVVAGGVALLMLRKRRKEDD